MRKRFNKNELYKVINGNCSSRYEFIELIPLSDLDLKELIIVDSQFQFWKLIVSDKILEEDDPDFIEGSSCHKEIHSVFVLDD